MALRAGLELADVFCFEELRVVQNDWTVRHDNQHYQILEENRPLPRPKDQVLVRRRLDGSTQLLYRDRPLKVRLLAFKELRRRAAAANVAEPSAPLPAPPRTPPKTNSPWRQNCIYMFADPGKKVSG